MEAFSEKLKGEFYTDETAKILYATDASVYKEMPLGVAIPKDIDDLRKIINYAKAEKASIIPRAAGTSLAGQVVGRGIVVDISKHFTDIIEINTQERWVTLQPGVIHQELNDALSKFNLFFGPETSTSNRCTIGGMVGNNSCGAHSVIYGSTRDHILSVKGLLADGIEVEFGELSRSEFEKKLDKTNCQSVLECNIYQYINDIIHDAETAKAVEDNFPKKEIHRRNTGYAIDSLYENLSSVKDDVYINMAKLIAGSEGTLCFLTEIKLGLVDVPPQYVNLVCVHAESIQESLELNLVALEFGARACELIDHFILECTKSNLEQSRNRSFIDGDPKAILIVEFADHNEDNLKNHTQRFIEELKKRDMGYHYPVLAGKTMSKVWELRKAGLGLLSNIPGDAKPVAVIEDTAVAVEDLPLYIQDFNEILKSYGKEAVHYAHAASGELHLRPILNLKLKEDRTLFRQIAEDIANLVKKYRGALSGEHGDGRLRGEFIPLVMGEVVYEVMKKLKAVFDPDNVFNPGKIVDSPAMDTFLRYQAGQSTETLNTLLDFSNQAGIIRSVEMCNGSGDCRKSSGIMCPSYQATGDEYMTTRARSNYIRERLNAPLDKNPFNDRKLIDILENCLSCKGCKSECPSNVDMAKVKSEVLYQYKKQHGFSLRDKVFANFAKSMKTLSSVAGLYNKWFLGTRLQDYAKKVLGIAPIRSMPEMSPFSLMDWYERTKLDNFGIENTPKNHRKIILFCDEFTNYLDVKAGISAVKFFTRLGFHVDILEHDESGRSHYSKGFLEDAKAIAQKNVNFFYPLLEDYDAIVGVEPSAILMLRDEYPDLLRGDLQNQARVIAEKTKTFEEFVAQEKKDGKISFELFTKRSKHILIHTHCHQKALTDSSDIKEALSIPYNFHVEMIDAGCCGMAGSFGYEKEKYDLSMDIGELSLFPRIRKDKERSTVIATGTSCRHQIKDATGYRSFHSAEILWKALEKSTSKMDTEELD